jgi:very-short-patch-repair endonuclease
MTDASDVRHQIRCKGRTRAADVAIADLAGQQHGIVARRQLAHLGLHRRAIDSRIATGRLHPIHRGVYAVGHRVLTREAAWMAAVLIADAAVLSHRSAAALWGIRPTERRHVEITVPRSLRPRAGLELHQMRLGPDEVTRYRGIPVTTPVRTLLDLATVLTRQQLERAATEAEIRRLGSSHSLEALIARYPTRAGSRAIRTLLAERSIGRDITKHELELRFLALLDAENLPRPRINARVDVPRQPVVDCLWQDRRVIAELDGFATHGTRTAFETDRARDRTLQVAGYRVIRITWRQLTSDAPTLAAEVRALLDRDRP